MTSLYNRATPSQQFILRIVEGAVKNVNDHHPDTRISPKTARSIAKRAAGTLSSQWGEVLAARAPSEKSRPLDLEGSRSRGRRGILRPSKRRPAQIRQPASTIAQIKKLMVKRMRAVRVEGHAAVYAACQEVLRLIAEAENGK